MFFLQIGEEKEKRPRQSAVEWELCFLIIPAVVLAVVLLGLLVVPVILIILVILVILVIAPVPPLFALVFGALGPNIQRKWSNSIKQKEGTSE